MTMVVAQIYPVFRRLTWVREAIMGVMAAFTGLLAGMVLVLGRPVLSVPAASVDLAGRRPHLLKPSKPCPIMSVILSTCYPGSSARGKATLANQRVVTARRGYRPPYALGANRTG